jgi:SAM-dependent methyltransferase
MPERGAGKGRQSTASAMSFYSDFADDYEAIFPFREETYAFLRRRLPPAPARVLDAGCGTGHYCGRLSVDGYRAVGVDLDPKMIEVARARYPRAEFQRLDMRAIDALSPPFHGAFCIGNTASHLTQEELAAFLRDLAALLTDGAGWILQVMNWDHILERGGYAFQKRQMGDGVVFERAYSDLSEERVRFSTRLLRDGAPVFEGWVWLHPARSQTYRDLHRAAGFEIVEQLGDFQERAFEPHGDSGNVLVFRKSGRR